MFYSRFKLIIALTCIITTISLTNYVDCAKKVPAPPPPPTEVDPIIEEVTAKQLERILQDKDFVAVYWCK